MSTSPPEKHDGRRTNALRHGRRMRQPPRAGMTIGSLGKGNGHAVVLLRQLRSALEAAVLEARGEVTLTDSAYINSACRHERSALLQQKWQKDAGDALPLATRLDLVRGIAAASDARDRAISRLKIERLAVDVWANLRPATATPTTPQDARERDAAELSTEGNEIASDVRTDEEAT